MAGTMSDWVIEMEKRGLEETAQGFHSDKLTDYNRLKESGLPIFDDFIIPFSEFDSKNEELVRFLSKYQGFVIRAIPNVKDLPRRYKIGVHSFEECTSFLSENVKNEDNSKYNVFLTEHEPTNWSGVIISRGGDALVEISSEPLDELSHGQVDSSLIYLGHFAKHNFSSFGSMKYNTRGLLQRNLIWRTLQHLREDLPSESETFPNISFRKGYFEFVVTEETGKIKFLDYKVKES